MMPDEWCLIYDTWRFQTRFFVVLIQSVASIKIFKHICDYSSQELLFFVFDGKCLMNNNCISSFLIFTFLLIFILVFFHNKIYLLHSGLDPGKETTTALGSPLEFVYHLHFQKFKQFKLKCGHFIKVKGWKINK